NLTFGLDVIVPDLPAPVKVSFDGTTTIESTTANITSVELTGNTEAIIDPLTTKNPYTFSVWSDTEASKLIFTPVFEMSEGASVASLTLKTADEDIEYKSGEAIDFSKIKNSKTDYLEVVIAAQDPNSTRTYKIVMDRLEALEQSKFTFGGEWSNNGQVGANFFEEPLGWSSSNTAAMFLKTLGKYPDNTPYPITKEGSYAKVISVDTEGAFILTVVPAVTAGTLFLGKFEVDIMNTLKSTKFGLPYRKEPVTLKGRYKYTSGPEYFMTKVEGQNVTKVPVEGKIDKGTINAVMYEVSNYNETLTGIDIYTSPKVVATAKMICESTAGFVDFSSNFEFVSGKSYDKTKKYKLAIVSSSSLEGDKFEGAPGSTLLIESLELISK
ncbi:MAG: PCMD domain-containing protein, partial [Bacteroidales bacterium]